MNKWITLLLVLFLLGCTSLKKAAIVSSVATTGALVGNAVSGNVGLVVGGLTSAFVADLATGWIDPDKPMECAPDNFWTVVGDLVQLGGWFLILIFIIPLVLGYLIPGPGHEKRKKTKIIQMPPQDS